MSVNKFALVAIAAVGMTAPLSERVAATEPMTAFLRNGRSVTGVVDIRTDDQNLWLRRTQDGFDLVSGFAWSEVAAGRIESHQLDAAQLRRWTEQNKQPGRPFAKIAAAASSHSRPLAQSALQSAKPKTLVIHAQLAQWDKDAQSDGLRVALSPLDAHGQIVPVDGQVEFTLVIEQERLNGGQRYVKGPLFPEGERRSFMVKREDFGGGAAYYELAFSKHHPDFDPNIASHALVHARLSVPTVGVFEASDAQVCLRQPSLFRDRLQYYTPGRYLPLESGGRPNR